MHSNLSARCCNALTCAEQGASDYAETETDQLGIRRVCHERGHHKIRDKDFGYELRGTRITSSGIDNFCNHLRSSNRSKASSKNFTNRLRNIDRTITGNLDFRNDLRSAGWKCHGIT